ncbi:metallophosphoesterase [Rhizobium leguminosarum]|uniref:metallophosphoesterase family protein n=1 Tax=Rhizobium leguminosarum TaxID=384 RepID=UPI003ECE48D0
MKIYAISDLHIGYQDNQRALAEITARPNDWLILAGDVGETHAHLKYAFEVLQPKFRQLVWVPGNHELWTMPSDSDTARGEFKYNQLINLCRSFQVLTPEDPYPVVLLGGSKVRIAPLFLLYDYSFRPECVPMERAVDWASEGGGFCSDEFLLHSDPYPGKAAWCTARCEITEQRLESCNDGVPAVLINHFPLLEDLIHLPRMPRFSLWCGTRRTRDWHIRFNACVVVSGHLHMRSTKHYDGVRFEEVSLGYPRQWKGRTTPDLSVREILSPNATCLEHRSASVHPS